MPFRRHTLTVCAVCVIALLLVPGGGLAEGPVTNQPGPGDDVSAHGDDVFASPARVIKLAFDIDQGQLEAMQRGSHAYGRATVREGGRSHADVGIRYKGNPAKEAASGKPDFTVVFNKFRSGQTFHGLARLILLAGRADPSYLSAPIGLELFLQAGVPAARSGFALVELNGHNLGLYVLVEGVDRAFLRRHFDQSHGNLYDEGDDTDVNGKLEKFGGKNSNDQLDVDALAAAALESDPGQRWQQLQRRLDVDRFITFAALEVLLWQDDSYSMKARKFRIYHDPVTDRLVFFPKGVEEVLSRTNGPVMPEWKGLVARAVLTTPEGERRYRAAVAKLLDTVFQPVKVQARARELAAAIRPAAVGTDAGAAREFDTAVAQFCDAVARRAAFVAEQLNVRSSK